MDEVDRVHTFQCKPFTPFSPSSSAFVSLIMNLTRIGAGTVFLLLSSQLFHSLSKSFIKLSVCEWIPITAAILLLPMWLGSPANFWFMAYLAMSSTIVGSVLLIIRIIIYISQAGVHKNYSVDSFENFAGAFGTILFAFGGASAFPNFQNDMRNKEKFPLAVIIGFLGMLFSMHLNHVTLVLCNRLDHALPAHRGSWLCNIRQDGQTVYNRQSG